MNTGIHAEVVEATTSFATSGRGNNLTKLHLQTVVHDDNILGRGNNSYRF